MRNLSRALLLGVVCTVALVAPVAAAAPTIERTPSTTPGSSRPGPDATSRSSVIEPGRSW